MFVSIFRAHQELSSWKLSALLVLRLRILFIILQIFATSNFLTFYVLFELSILPIFFLITGWGYQPERIAASYAMFFYTLLARAPLVVVLVKIFFLTGKTQFYEIRFIAGGEQSGLKFLIFYAIFAGFLVKLPIYGVHLWLPKAHVEAPVYGSMLLAGVLLKLGGMGIIRAGALAYSDSAIFLVIRISIWGGAYIRLNCLKLTDLKQIIALSSVGHMAFSILTVFFFSKLGIKISFIVLITHAFSSSAIFYGAFAFYLRSHRRRILLNKGVLTPNPWIRILWALIIIASIGTPPAVNAISEIMSISLIVSHIPTRATLLVVIFVAGRAYSIIMYRSTQQESVSTGVIALTPFTPTINAILLFHTLLIYISPLAMNYFL